MVVDFHTHIFPDAIAERTIASLEEKSGINAATNGTLNGLLASMAQAQVDLSVILPVVTKPSQFERINTFAKTVNEEYEGQLLSFGGIHPDSEDYRKELKIIKEYGLKGVKIHPDYQGVVIDDIRYKRIISYANELDLIIVTHAGVDIGIPEPVHCPPDKMRQVLDELKPKNMVLAHYGGWKQWQEVYELLAGEDVYLDTAFTFDFIEQDMFLKILEKHDKKKILFATDSPWSSVKRDMEHVRRLPVADDIKEDILCNNALRLLKK